jgi:hypothetical protein
VLCPGFTCDVLAIEGAPEPTVINQKNQKPNIYMIFQLM